MAISLLQILLIAGALQGVILSFLLFTRKNNQVANRILSFLMITLSIQIVLVAFDNREFFMAYPHISKVSWLLPTLFGPLLFLFTKKLLSENSYLKAEDAIHLFPFLLYFVLLASYFFQSAGAKRIYLDNFEVASIDDFGLLNQVTNGIHVLYSFAALVVISRHQKKILHIFSEVRNKKVRWLKDFIRLAILIILFGIFIFYSRKWNVPLLANLYHYHYLGVVIIIYWIGYKALSQPHIFEQQLLSSEENISVLSVDSLLKEEIEQEVPGDVKYKKSGLNETEGALLENKILKYMEEHKPYLRNNLNLVELALEMGISKHYLSQVLNERLQQNFYTFINNYRVAEAKKLLIDPSMSNYNTLVVAMEAGFNSKATFNAVFKKFSGMTPTAYVASCKKEWSDLIGRDDFRGIDG